jgi:hypothetical protein
MWRVEKALVISLGSNQCAVCSGVQKIGHCGEAHLDEPASAVGVSVDRVGACHYRIVRFDNFTGDGGEDFTHGLGGFDFTDNRTFANGVTHAWQRNENNVTERIGGVLGDPDRGNIAIDLHPFVFCCVGESLWYSTHDVSFFLE